jgi:uncharacterized membrane protein
MNSRIVLAFTLAFASAATASAASLKMLPDWFGHPSVSALWMLPDGATFVGIDGGAVFRWSEPVGRTDMGLLPATLSFEVSEASALRPTRVSDDGSTIIGYLGDNPITPRGGFIWSPTEGAVVMSSSSGARNIYPIPTALSSDGSVVVGNELFVDLWSARRYETGAFRWTSDTGTVPLDGFQVAADVSADGSVVVGTGPYIDEVNQAVRWTQSTGAVELGVLPNSRQPDSGARFVSADGATVVGDAYPPDAQLGAKMFSWTEAAGMQQLSTLGDDQMPRAISADAKVILGMMRTIIPGEGPFNITWDQFIWTPHAGIQRLPELLASWGVGNLQTTGLWDLRDVSGNGQTVFGAFVRYENTEGSNIPTVHRDYWLLDIAPVPEPSTLHLCILSVLTLLTVRPSNFPKTIC